MTLPLPRGAERARGAPVGLLAFGLVLLAALERHLGAILAPFFADDYVFLDQARTHSLIGALTHPDPIGNFLRPVSRQIYFSLIARTSGESPVAFHAANLGLFLASVALLFAIVRRLAGVRAAAVAGTFLALHYAADVPVLWSSGSQDLLAVAGGLGAVSLYLDGRRFLAALAYAVAVLSKESVCVIPLVAILLSRVPGESRGARIVRAWPLLAVGCAWALLWISTAHLRKGAAAVMSADPLAFPAALIHLAQVSLAAEPGTAGALAGKEFLLGLAAALGAVAWAWSSRAQDLQATPLSAATPTLASPGMSPRRAAACGAGWAALGALPVVAVASIWSAYFYLFALCGVALTLGVWLARRPRWQALLATLALALASERARHLHEFATARGAWTAHSHVNRFYIERSMRYVTRYLADLERQRPSLPHHSTLLFADVPSASGWQVGDGALLRWAYRDTTLRSVYFTSFSPEMARRGPLFFFVAENDSLRDHSSDQSLLGSLAYSMILCGKPAGAAGVLSFQLERNPEDRLSRYWLAWAQWAAGDSAAGARSLARSGVLPAPGPTPEVAPATAMLAARDTASAIRVLLAGRDLHGLDPEVHSRLAALLLPRESRRSLGVIEALAVTVLSPRRADGWRKLAAGQLSEHQYAPAAESLRRYFALGGEAAGRDTEAREVMASLRRVLPGGDLAQAGLRN